MRNILSLSAVLLLAMTACTSMSESSSVSSAGIPSETELAESLPVVKAKELVDNNTYIDVDPEWFDNQARLSPNTAHLEHPREFEMLRAATYRFYSRISLLDGKLVCSAKKASDINVSERVFNYMNDNFNETNRIEEEGLKNLGKEYTPILPPAAYLEALLKE